MKTFFLYPPTAVIAIFVTSMGLFSPIHAQEGAPPPARNRSTVDELYTEQIRLLVPLVQRRLSLDPSATGHDQAWILVLSLELGPEFSNDDCVGVRGQWTAEVGGTNVCRIQVGRTAYVFRSVILPEEPCGNGGGVPFVSSGERMCRHSTFNAVRVQTKAGQEHISVQTIGYVRGIGFTICDFEAPLRQAPSGAFWAKADGCVLDIVRQDAETVSVFERKTTGSYCGNLCGLGVSLNIREAKLSPAL